VGLKLSRGLPFERLSQSFPNPFHENTTITLNLKADGHVRLVVHNLAGEQVAVLIDEPLEPGVHNVEWNGRNRAGRDLPAPTRIPWKSMSSGQAER
jgi:hypothetical protein